MNMHLTNSDTIQARDFDPASYLREAAARRARLMGKPKSVNIIKTRPPEPEPQPEPVSEEVQKRIEAIDARAKLMEEEIRRLKRIEEIQKELINQRLATLEAVEKATSLEKIDPGLHRVHALATIMRRACKAFRVSPSELSGGGRTKNAIFARQFVAYWGSRLTGLSCAAIGKRIGGRDPATVLHNAAVYPSRREMMGRHLRKVNGFVHRPLSTKGWVKK